MAFQQPHGTLGKVTSVLQSFSFIPLHKTLPVERRITQTPVALKASPDPDAAEVMADEAEVIYLPDPEENKPGERSSDRYESYTTVLHPECVKPEETSGPKPVNVNNISETLTGRRPPQNTLISGGVTPGLFVRSSSERADCVSPASSTDFLTSPASSRESVHTEEWDKEQTWPAFPLSLQDCFPDSRPVSSCSSVRSGAFTPSVVRIRKLSLAPGSSLLEMTTACGTPCSESLVNSPCSFSPRGQHRPPPTRLSLLTAILRKGRLPVLSSAFQRPYSPCWPINAISMSSCLACSAASVVSPMTQFDKNSSQRDTCQAQAQKHHWVSVSEQVKAPDKPSREVQDRPYSICNSGTLSLPSQGNSLILLSSPTIKSPSFHLNKPDESSRTYTTPLPPTPRALSGSKTSYINTPSGKTDRVCFEGLTEHEVLDVSVKDTLAPGRLQKSSQLSKPWVEQTVNPLHSCKLKPTETLHKPKACSLLEVPESMEASSRLKKSDPDVRVSKSSTDVKVPPSLRPVGLTRLSYSVSPVVPLCHSKSRSSTPEQHSLSPSPAYSRSQLSPQPPRSLCSSPSPSLWRSSYDYTDGESKDTKTYKIKSIYKEFAAIPSNVPLLEQQAIDEAVNKKAAWIPASDEDTHAEMCSPSQLRQQSSDLYAAIQEVLEDSVVSPRTHTTATPKSPFTEVPRPHSLYYQSTYRATVNNLRATGTGNQTCSSQDDSGGTRSLHNKHNYRNCRQSQASLKRHDSPMKTNAIQTQPCEEQSGGHV